MKKYLTKFFVLALVCGATGSYAQHSAVIDDVIWEAGTVKSSLPIGRLTFLTYNMGANPNMTVDEQVAYSSTDEYDATVYGDLYQWGRNTDGHEKRTSQTTDILSATDVPGHSMFILNANYYLCYDWRNPQNHTLWSSTKTANDPCPDGFRVPTIEEWTSILPSDFNGSADNIWTWVSEGGTNGWKISPDGGTNFTLFLSAAGYRHNEKGIIGSDGVSSHYWSSTSVYDRYSMNLAFSSTHVGTGSVSRADGRCIRCVKENAPSKIDLPESGKLNIYPNPVKDELHINLPDFENPSSLNVTITDLSGRIVISHIASGSPINVGYLPAGVYLVQIGDYRRKFVKK